MDKNKAGWQLKQGKLILQNFNDDDYWEVFNFLYSTRSKKRNSYKFALIKSIIDNIAHCNEKNNYTLSYKLLFEKFTHNYWNLSLKYNLKQMRPDGKSNISKIEQLLTKFYINELDSVFVEFYNIDNDKKNILINTVENTCKQYVIGALYKDFRGKVFGFNDKDKFIILHKNAVEFLYKYKKIIQTINYFYWAKFLESIDNLENKQLLLSKLELATPRRNDLSKYKELLINEGSDKCFYCGKKLNNNLHVDHFIPWSFMHDDYLWNFVLACPKCNIKKKDKIAIKKINDIINRNENLEKHVDGEYFNCYTKENFKKIIESAIKQGYEEFSI